MPEATTTATELTETEPATGSATEPTETTSTDTTDWRAEADKWKAQARKHEERAKTNANASKDLETLRQQSMSDQEKAVAQARAEGKAEALREGASKIVEAKIEAAAAGRLDDDQLKTLLENVDLARFVDESGDVDGDKVAKFVEGIAPKTEQTEPVFPDLGQGARGSTSKADANPLLADMKKIAGVR